MKQRIAKQGTLCDQKKNVVLEVNKAGAWTFPETARDKPQANGDLRPVSVEVDGAGRFIEVWSNGERFEIGADEVSELAASIIPPAVLGALQAYDGTEGVPVRDLTKAQLKRIESYEKRRLTA